MFRFIFLISFTAALTSALPFTDCDYGCPGDVVRTVRNSQFSDTAASDKTNTALTVHMLDLFPSPIVFPGELRLFLHLTINQRITHLFIDMMLEKPTLGFWTTIPCIQSINVGSCNNIDACTLLDRIWNGSSQYMFYAHQIDAIFLSALGYRVHCPIDPTTMFMCNERLKLQDVRGFLGSIFEGDFRVTISVKDDPTRSDNLGCIQFNTSIARAAYPQALG